MIIGLRKYIIRDERGFNMVELFIAMVIGIIALAGTIKIFTTQQSLLKDENDSTKVRAKGRQAMTVLAREVRMAGYGLPEGEGIITPMNANEINFRSNLDYGGTHATAFVDSTSGPYTTSVTSLSIVAPGTPFNDGDHIVVFNPNDTDVLPHYTSANGAVAATATTISFDDATNVTPLSSGGENQVYTFSAFANVVMISRYSDYNIKLVGNQIIKTIDSNVDTAPITIVLVDNVAVAGSDGLKFEYLDSDGASTTDSKEVRQVAITLNMLDPKNPDAAIEFKTDVQIRNSGT